VNPHVIARARATVDDAQLSRMLANDLESATAEAGQVVRGAYRADVVGVGSEGGDNDARILMIDELEDR
jgi:hypothetical protein